MTPNLTPLEAELLNIIAYDLYNPSNGSQPTSYNDVACGVWTWSVSDSWPHAKRSLPGVVSSLVQKGLVFTVEATTKKRGRDAEDDAAIGMTETGYAAWQTVDKNRPATKPSKKKTLAAAKAKMDKAEPVKPTVVLKPEDLLVICVFEKGQELERSTIEAQSGLGAETCYRVLRSLVARGILTQRMHCGTKQLGFGKTAPVRVARFSLA